MIIFKSDRPKSRPLSASRQRRQRNRRSSLNSNISSPETIQDPVELLPESTIFYGGLDLRPTKEKIESLEKEMELRKDDSTVYVLLLPTIILLHIHCCSSKNIYSLWFWYNYTPVLSMGKHLSKMRVLI